ncbi:MAG: hypothetical protein ACREDG_04630 [Methylocella sp.]
MVFAVAEMSGRAGKAAATNALEHGRFYRVSKRYPNVVPRMGDVLKKDMAYNA